MVYTLQLEDSDYQSVPKKAKFKFILYIVNLYYFKYKDINRLQGKGLENIYHANTNERRLKRLH